MGVNHGLVSVVGMAVKGAVFFTFAVLLRRSRDIESFLQAQRASRLATASHRDLGGSEGGQARLDGADGGGALS
jgi:hypothetical protein